MAIVQLSMLHSVRNAVSSLLDKKGWAHYQKQEAKLREIVDGPPQQDPEKNRRALEKRLLALGAKAAHSSAN